MSWELGGQRGLRKARGEAAHIFITNDGGARDISRRLLHHAHHYCPPHLQAMSSLRRTSLDLLVVLHRGETIVDGDDGGRNHNGEGGWLQRGVGEVEADGDARREVKDDILGGHTGVESGMVLVPSKQSTRQW